MRCLYVVTHPEATHRVGGWYDSEWTPRGLQHAQLIAEDLAARIPADSEVELFSSDLRQTRQTAQPIASRFALEVVFDAGLREQSYGAAEGTTPGSTRFVAPPPVGDRMRHQDGVAGSETRLGLATRVYGALDRVLAGSACHSVVVTHGGAATFLVAGWIGMPIEAAGYVKFAVSPGSITVLCEDDLFHDHQVVVLNDVGHLT